MEDLLERIIMNNEGYRTGWMKLITFLQFKSINSYEPPLYIPDGMCVDYD